MFVIADGFPGRLQYHNCIRGPHNIVSIVTCYRLGGLGFEPW